jgi:nitrous oxidase accessory protein NosD
LCGAGDDPNRIYPERIRRKHLLGAAAGLPVVGRTLKSRLASPLLALLLLGSLLVVSPPPGAEAAYAVRGAIRIDGDAGLCAPASGVVNCATADGSAARPYLISGWQITVENVPAVDLRGTTKYVEVRNNLLIGVQQDPFNNNYRPDGIFLISAQHVTVRSNEIRGVTWGVLTSYGGDVKIIRNTFRDASTGVLVADTPDVLIDHNLFKNNFDGVSIRASGARILGNQFEDNVYALDFQSNAVGAVAKRNNMLRTIQFAAENFSSSPVDARCNYWGASSGPSLPPNYTGAGGRIYGNVNWNPHLTQPDPYTGPAGQDPILPPLDKTVEYALSPCYDLVPGGPI